jgi:hypothetical protein
MGRPMDPIFQGASITNASSAGHDIASIKTYRYLRIGMLAAVAALVYSVVEEYLHPGVHCLLGSFSGYYYTPVHGVFISVMVAIGLALIIIKGKTAYEDAFLSLAGMMAPIVAFIPTSDDLQGVCRPQMLQVGDYQPDPGSRFIPASISNNLHALVFAGTFAIALVLIAFLIQRGRRNASTDEYTTGTWINLGIGLAVVVAAWILLRTDYHWVLEGHARAACAMFGFLAAAAGVNSWFGFRNRQKRSDTAYASIYGVVGLAMIVSGLLFIIFQSHNRSSFGGHLVLAIEGVEIFLFIVFWAVQTVERWNETV